jgi:hypothetical protein
LWATGARLQPQRLGGRDFFERRLSTRFGNRCEIFVELVARIQHQHRAFHFVMLQDARDLTAIKT